MPLRAGSDVLRDRQQGNEGLWAARVCAAATAGAVPRRQRPPARQTHQSNLRLAPPGVRCRVRPKNLAARRHAAIVTPLDSSRPSHAIDMRTIHSPPPGAFKSYRSPTGGLLVCSCPPGGSPQGFAPLTPTLLPIGSRDIHFGKRNTENTEGKHREHRREIQKAQRRTLILDSFLPTCKICSILLMPSFLSTTATGKKILGFRVGRCASENQTRPRLLRFPTGTTFSNTIRGVAQKQPVNSSGRESAAGYFLAAGWRRAR